MLNRPRSVQRCIFKEGRLVYDYMGKTEFEVGDQAKSLRLMFSEVMRTGKTAVRVNDHEVAVFFVAIKGFRIREYQPYLQQMAERTIQLKEWSKFDTAIQEHLG